MLHTGRKPNQRRVALLIESSRAYARELIRGIAQFNRERQHWLLEFTPRGLDDPPPAWLKDWQGDGVLARVNGRRMVNALSRTGVPVVDLRRIVRAARVPSVGPNDATVAQMVWDHFCERGFQRFAFVGLPPGVHRAMDARAEHFLRQVHDQSAECHELRVREPARGDRWDRQCKQIRRWLESLPTPVAIMACNDDVGLKVLDACRRASLRVPDQIAVAGVGNDECLCDLAIPALTSVDLNPRRIGYEAARLLDRMIEGEVVGESEYLVAPRTVISRMSTDVVATGDPHVAQAALFVRMHACDGIQVVDVLRHVCVSRASLEPRFKRVLGRSVHQEIQRVRLARVQELLATTEMPIKQIARQAGFRYPEYMMRVFRRVTGQTLKQYRNAVKL